MRPARAGTGRASDVDRTALSGQDMSVSQGAITVPGYARDGWYVQLFSESGFLDPDKPIREYTEAERHDFLYKEPTKVPVGGANMTYEGLVPKIRKTMLSKDPAALQPHIRAFVEREIGRAHV